jgi:hypothetical protein
VNVETKEQSKQWMHIHSSNICQKAYGNYFLGQERHADGGIHSTRYHNFRNVLQNIKKKNCIEPFRTKGVEW